MSRFCPTCRGVHDTTHDEGRVVCTECGHVFEESTIVNEVQFSENAAGGMSVVGTFVSGMRSLFRGLEGTNPESREITLQKGNVHTQ